MEVELSIGDAAPAVVRLGTVAPHVAVEVRPRDAVSPLGVQSVVRRTADGQVLDRLQVDPVA